MYRFIIKLLSCFALLGLHAGAQNLFLLSGSGSSNNTVQVFSPQLSSLASFAAGGGAFTVVSRTGGTEFYVVSTGSSQVTSVNNTFGTPTTVANLSAPATAAAISPSGNRLLVLAGTLHIFDTSNATIFGTSSDMDLTGTSGLQAPSATEVDFAFSLDGNTGYLLTQSGSGSTLFQIDLTNSSFSLSGVPSISIPGLATGVAVAPTGLIYVSTANLIEEINPTTLNLTAKGTIAVVGTPGKSVFSPDGHYLIAPNGSSGGPWVEVDLTTDTPVDTTHTGFTGVAPGTLFAAGDGTAYGYSAQAQTLYTLTLASPVSIAATNIPGVSQPGVTAVALSPEVAGGSVTGPHYLYFVVNSILYRLDLTVNQISGQVALLQPADAMSDAGAAFTGVAATLLTFGANQQVPPSDLTLPLVVRALDANGNPLFGVPVAFSTTDPGVTIETSSVNTAANGYASTTAVTAASSSGMNVITATVGSLAPVNFNINLGTGTGPGSPGQGQGGLLAITAGQGIVAYQDLSVGNGYGPPLTVQVTDAAGAPLPNTTVTFTNTTPIDGSLSGGNGTINNGTITVTTNSNGIASAAYVTNAIETNLGHSQAVVTASAPGEGMVSFYLTIIPEGTTNGGAANVDFSGAPPPDSVIKGSAGSTLANALTIRIFDGQGVPIPNVSLRMVTPGANPSGDSDATLDADSPYATCAAPPGQVALTDATGSATCNLKFLQQTFGQNQAVAIDVGYYLERAIFLNIGEGQPATISLAPVSASGNPGQAVSTTVKVTDGAGNPLSGVSVSFQAQTANTITLSSGGAVTNSQGQATLSGTLGGTAGTYQVAVTAGSASANFPFTVIIPVTAVVPVSGGNQTTLVNTPFTAPLVVVVNTANGVAAGVPVTFTASNGAILSSPSATTDSTGKASTMVTAGSSTGTITVTAAASGHSAAFNLTVVQSFPPAIATSNATVTLTLTAGSTVQGVVPVQITNSGGGSLNWTATSDSPWLTPNPVSGTAPSTLNIVGSAANLTAGPYSGKITISAPGATSMIVSVSLTVAPPAVSIASVVNGASFLQTTAQNGWITITGTGLSNTTRTWQSSDFVNGQLPVSLDGVSVTINGAAAYVYYISPTQINVLAPLISFEDGANSATVPVAVTAPDGSASSTVLIQTVAPGVFLLGNTKYAAAIHSDGTLVAPVGTFPGSTSRPAQPGETISIFLSGLGTNTNPPVPAGMLLTTDSVLVDTATVSIGGTGTSLSFAGLVGPGLYQVNVVVPNVATGDQSFALTVDAVSTQTGVLVSVQD
jgi:uncharacterized protein (TIGR03437 family)